MKTIFRNCITVSVLMLMAGGVWAEDQEQPETAPPVRPSDYVFKTIKIEPSPDDGDYVGHFQFINRQTKDVRIFGEGEPIHGKFRPMYVGFETLVDGAWKEIQVGYCGTGAQNFAMKSKEPYEFICGLWAFEEQEAPLTARIKLDGFVSEPFVLDWKKDRAKGAFIDARKRHFEEVRTAFAKAGFKPELLKGDDFCERIFRSMFKATESARDDGFNEFKGKLDVTPYIGLNGNIRMDFRSADITGSSQYFISWVINPDKFSPKWFKNTSRKHVEASQQLNSFVMKLDDGSVSYGPDVHLYLEIRYNSSEGAAKLPTEENAKQLFLKMLDNLEPWLK